MSAPATILLVEDERLVRQGLKLMIESAPDLEVAGEAANGREALELIARRAFDLVILDVRMPEMDGVKAAQRILQLLPEQKLLFLTTFDDDEYALSALRLGVRGYLLKNADPERLIASIRSVLQGGMPLQDSVAAKLLPRLLRGAGEHQAAEVGASPTEALTERELSVVRLVGSGRSNAEIAADLGISQGTVRNVVSAALEKLELRDRTQLAIYALRHGLA